MSEIIIAFDLYGTLLSTNSIAQALEKHFGHDKAQTISALWRRYQLEYTWRLNSMGRQRCAPIPSSITLTVSERYVDFDQVTRNSLQHALSEHNEKLSDNDTDQLLEAYDHLSTFSDVNPALNRVGAEPTLKAVIFSNGTKTMVANSVLRSKDLAPHASVFSDIVTVDHFQQYKPARASYQHLADQVGKDPKELWLVSGNPFDIVGARNMGMNAIWVDRACAGWKDAAVPALRPTCIVHSLEHVVGAVLGK
ncbi:hypothetical protein N7510_001912 [Penicillium lagena]|uniref:uncharacterized protein n=1 Tax=Penicillium lagena TaxID=94218 RepID=UPI0025406333|nr:uncharacterized protein N7510_001912 [Penicillium lagena]KAJ5625603.1 hypothetical protein N7510_001912 [Penicillium lagena]